MAVLFRKARSQNTTALSKINQVLVCIYVTPVSRRGVVNLQHNLTGMFRAGRIVPKNGEDRLIEYLTLNEFVFCLI